MTISSANIL